MPAKTPIPGEVWSIPFMDIRVQVLETEHWTNPYSRVRVEILDMNLKAQFLISWFLEYFEKEDSVHEC